MTNEEWKKLRLKAKNDGSYNKLCWSIKDWVYHNTDEMVNSVEKFVTYFSRMGVENWYRRYFSSQS